MAWVNATQIDGAVVEWGVEADGGSIIWSPISTPVSLGGVLSVLPNGDIQYESYPLGSIGLLHLRTRVPSLAAANGSRVTAVGFSEPYVSDYQIDMQAGVHDPNATLDKTQVLLTSAAGTHTEAEVSPNPVTGAAFDVGTAPTDPEDQAYLYFYFTPLPFFTTPLVVRMEYDITPAQFGPPAPGASATNFNCECDGGPAFKTLAAYRRDLLIRCGFAAVVNNPPPGVTLLMDTFLRDAQTFLYHKYPALHTRRFFRWDMQQGVRFYGMLENNDSTMSRIAVTFDTPTADLIEVTWAGYDAPPTNRGIFFTAAEGEALPYGLLPNTVYYVVNPANGVSNLALTPGGTPITVVLGSDVNGVSHGYAEIRQAIFDLEPYKNIEGAWVVDVNGTWFRLVAGIPPSFYTTVSQPSLPTRYEIRSCIEVFPAPQHSQYKLYIKGHFGLRPFELDGDKPTIDGHLVYLWALANVLDYYGKPAAAGVATQAQDYLGQLTAGTHGSKRYVPGERPLPPAVMPILAPYPGESN